jgi:hypothetical protein
MRLMNHEVASRTEVETGVPFIHLHSMDPYIAGRPVDIEIVKTTGQIPSII